MLFIHVAVQVETMISVKFYSDSILTHLVILLILLLLEATVISSKCTDHHESIVFVRSDEPSPASSSLAKRSIPSSSKLNLFHEAPSKLPVVDDERTYRFVGEAAAAAASLIASYNQSTEVNYSQPIDTPLINSNLVKEKRDSRIENNRLIEESHDTSSSVEIPEDILIQMSQMDRQEFFEEFVDVEADHHEPASSEHSEDETDDVSVSMLMRGSNTDVEGPIGSRRKVPPLNLPQKTCTLEFKNVELPRPDDVVLYYPMCVRIARCSGCCASSRLKCTPSNITQQSVDVTLLKFNPDRKKLYISGVETYKFEKHEDCSCQCIQQASDCNENQMYIPHECRCACRDSSRASSCVADAKKIWQSDQCSCVCKHRSSCTTGTIFNEQTCRCEIKKVPTLISALGLDNVGSIRISHSTYDVEIKKQDDFNYKTGAHDGGINTETANARKVTTFFQ